MWSRPHGERVLLVGSEDLGRFISAVYHFDAVERVPIDGQVDGATVRVSAGDLELTLHGGRGWPIPMAGFRGRSLGRRVEAPLARWFLGVRTSGTSPTGVDEWYRADQYRRVVEGRATLAGDDLGALCGFGHPTGFGFSEPPRRPAVVRVRPLLVDPSGDLGRVVAGIEESRRRRASADAGEGPGHEQLGNQS